MVVSLLHEYCSSWATIYCGVKRQIFAQNKTKFNIFLKELHNHEQMEFILGVQVSLTFAK